MNKTNKVEKGQNRKNFMIDEITKEFLDGSRLVDLSNKYSISLELLRKKLREKLGNRGYSRAYHTNGAKAVFRKSKDPKYRARYLINLGKGVSKGIKEKMKDPLFRRNWLQKSRSASKKGTKVLLEKLKDDVFYAKIKKGWKLGGLIAKKRNHGIHSASPKKRREWSIAALKRISKNSIGPKNEKMYNWLEVYLASEIHNLGLDYTYEKIFHVKNKNGFVSVDFRINRLPNLLIEATCWNKPKQKSKELNRKFYLIKEKLSKSTMVVVVPRKYLSNYRKYLQKTIKVLTPIEFKRFLNSRLAG